MSQLFTPISLRGLALENRIMISPMCQYSARDGCASDWHLIHLGTLAQSGAGLLFLEATAVTPEGRITPGCLGLYSDANEAALAHVIAAVRRWSKMPLGIQLSHAGRKGSSFEPWNGGALMPAESGGWRTLAPSAVPQSPGEPPPDILDEAGMRRIRNAFAASAGRADRIGLEAMELHFAHGYLVHEFLSPLSNRRTDRYGGTLENRMRFALEVFDAVRQAWPAEKPLGVRLSATDWVEGGWDLDSSVALSRRLKARGCDWIDCSGGGISPQQKIPLGPGYQVPLANRIRRETGVTTIAIGLITEPAQAEAIIAGGDADMVALARAMLWNPHWAWHAAAELGGTIQAPRQYWRSPPRGKQATLRGSTNRQR
ncbi:MAG: oxidoreductase [Betaproteobacteria bacterium RIFCSPLOWO2_02_FULL_65_20]|nr:MAG: oxidoreductase [Betaproteobacteria bacterium RIFCSPLOWO2_02_FULL_65_20]